MKKRNIVLGLLVVCLSACASTSSLQMVQPMTSRIDAASSAYIDVVSKDTKYEELSVKLKDALFAKLISRSVFNRVTANRQEAVDYTIKVVIESAKEVSGAQRVWLGVLAGANKITATVVVKEKGNVVATFIVSAESAMMPISTQDGLTDAIREASDKIISGITNKT
ncbi:MAG: DUF4410 domain-containing protein [Candidatus Scalindua sp.]|nr:DUF4410 domain-containing protein [Candidatus Scalindua sp.]